MYKTHSSQAGVRDDKPEGADHEDPTLLLGPFGCPTGRAVTDKIYVDDVEVNGCTIESGADLRRANPAWVDLRHANLAGANLGKVDRWWGAFPMAVGAEVRHDAAMSTYVYAMESLDG